MKNKIILLTIILVILLTITIINGCNGKIASFELSEEVITIKNNNLAKISAITILKKSISPATQFKISLHSPNEETVKFLDTNNPPVEITEFTTNPLDTEGEKDISVFYVTASKMPGQTSATYTIFVRLTHNDKEISVKKLKIIVT